MLAYQPPCLVNDRQGRLAGRADTHTSHPCARLTVILAADHRAEEGERDKVNEGQLTARKVGPSLLHTESATGDRQALAVPLA